MGMTALPPRADMLSAESDVRAKSRHSILLLGGATFSSHQSNLVEPSFLPGMSESSR